MSTLYNLGTSNTDKPYNVDVYLNNYMDSTTYTANIDFEKYIAPIMSATITYEPSSVASQYDKTIGLTIDASFEGSTLSCSINVNDTSASTGIPGTTNAFSGYIDAQDINLVIESGSEVTQLKTDIVEKVAESIGVLSRTFRANHGPTADPNIFNTINHAEFDEYLLECNRAITNFQLAEAYESILAHNQEKTATTAKEEETQLVVLNAVRDLKVIQVPWKLVPLIQDIEKALKECLYTILAKMPSTANTMDLARAFQSRDSMVSGPSRSYYYALRRMLTDRLKISKQILYEEDASTYYFVRKLLADLYIKTAYPMIHYHLLSVLMQMSIEKGDFINARFAMLAKCTFTYYFISVLTTSVESVPESVVTELPQNIMGYIQRNNSGRFDTNDKDTNIAAIMVELHDMSNQVVSIADSSQILNQSIKENQLTFRNVNAAIEARKGEVAWKNTQYYLEIAFLVCLIAACGVLYFFNKIDIGIMVAGGSFAAVLLLVLILMIITFITKN